jgi:hypothetical protein
MLGIIQTSKPLSKPPANLKWSLPALRPKFVSFPVLEPWSSKILIVSKGTSFLALSLRAEGYEVFANTDASGTFNDKLAADANRRMEAAGVHLMGMFGIAMDLMRDWRNTPGSAEVLPFMDK